jgi:hypothetical protein
MTRPRAEPVRVTPTGAALVDRTRLCEVRPAIFFAM